MDLILLYTVLEEVEDNLLPVVQNRAHANSWIEEHRLHQRAKQRLEDLRNGGIESNLGCTEDEIADLRERFEKLDKDMPPFAKKDPIPDPGDLRVMIESSKLSYERKFVISRDKHFLAYPSELLEWFDIVVLDGRKVHNLAAQWRG